MHWTTYRHIPGGTPEKPTRPQARQANSAPDAANSRLQDAEQPMPPSHCTALPAVSHVSCLRAWG
jgi:hypothetical protein